MYDREIRKAQKAIRIGLGILVAGIILVVLVACGIIPTDRTMIVAGIIMFLSLLIGGTVTMSGLLSLLEAGLLSLLVGGRTQRKKHFWSWRDWGNK